MLGDPALESPPALARGRGPRPVLLALNAMATRFELVLAGEDEARLRAAGEAALEEIRECERRLDRFDPASLVSLLNREAAQRWVRVDGDTFALLERCEAIRRESEGAFDLRVGARMDALGFHPARTAPASDRSGAILLDGERCAVRFEGAGTSLDFGAVGKGHALDLAAETLRALGVERALIHGGTSSVVALGAPPDAEAWLVALGQGPHAPIALLRDAALATSAPHGRTIERGGVERGHVLDPRSGAPADAHAFAAVIHSSAREADAWSTALVVSGIGLARRCGLAALVARRDERQRLRWSESRIAACSGRFELPHELLDRPCTIPTAGTS